MENSKALRTWLDDMQLDHPLVIAGPCSAETETQVLDIAHQLKNTDVNYYRQVFGNLVHVLEASRVLVP
jgi:chorismate mutase